jgi:glycosyltransferase involved in cell wall biosynthesis
MPAYATKVSVLMPVYNAGHFLAECLTSVLAQDFQDMEILIADDGSTDGTVDIIRDFAARDARIRWWQNPRNLGLVPNHNACLRAARGEFIKLVHGDDKFLHPLALARMVAILEQEPTVSLVAAGSEIIDENSRLLRVQKNYWPTGIQDGQAVIVQCLAANGNLIGEPVRALFRQCQARRGFDGRYRQIMDLEMWFHLLEQGRFAYLAEPLFAYRVHAQQATAVHHCTRVCEDEQLMLATDYCCKPWLIERAGRRMWFRQIYSLRRKYGARSLALTTGMMARLKRFWYAVYWLEYKMSQPFKKLGDRSRRLQARSSRP